MLKRYSPPIWPWETAFGFERVRLSRLTGSLKAEKLKWTNPS
jgi:hypothetical protein